MVLRSAYLALLCGLLVFPDIASAQQWEEVLTKDSIRGWEPKRGAADDSWTVRDGVLHCSGKAVGRQGTVKDWGEAWIGTKAEYTDFAIEFEFRLAPGGNSGVFLRVPKTGHPTFDGMEVQILDDDAPEYKGILPGQRCGALYKIAPPTEKATRPAGQWSRMRVTVIGSHVVVELNGRKIVDANGTTHPEILKRSAKGPIGLQNHSTPLEFRKIRVADLAKSKE